MPSIVRLLAGVVICAPVMARAFEPPAEPPAEPAPPQAEAPATPPPEPIADGVEPQFEVTPVDGWVIIQKAEKKLVLAKKDSPIPVPPEWPIVVITTSSKVVTEETVRRQSVTRFGDDMKRWTFRGQPKIEKITANGLPGYDCVRRATRTADEFAQRVYVGTLFTDEGKLIMLGQCPDDDAAAEAVKAFKAMMLTVKPRATK